MSVSTVLAGHVAEIVLLHGKGEAKNFDGNEWRRASVQQKLEPGSFVRTGDMSNLALLFADQTQIRVGQNSQLQIKTVNEANDGDSQTAVRLNSGRAWAQTKNVTGKFTMSTPTASMTIRGTDWDVEVDESGKSTLTVLSGSIEFSNTFGSITVDKGEQAVAEKGKPPLKQLISNPKERVQWVTAYEVDPLRYIRLSQTEDIAALADAADDGDGAALYDLHRHAEAKFAFGRAQATQEEDFPAAIGMALLALQDKELENASRWLQKAGNGELAQLTMAAYWVRSGEMRAAKNLLDTLVESGPLNQPAAYLILADFMVYQGLLKDGVEIDRRALTAFPGSPQVQSHLAKLLILSDQGEESQAAVNNAIGLGTGSIEPYLTQGELARWGGNSKGAEAGFSRAIAINPADDRGWFGLGTVFNEMEDIRRGREKLNKAIELNPDGPGYRGELGTLETFANRYAEAGMEFEAALERNPEDYVALTGYGVMLLKRGEAEAALQQFLKASVIEPRYARSHLYTGVAYYQLGRTSRALEEITKAKELDPHDPMPSMIASMIHTDEFEPAKAIAESRRATELMPYLKSMNQLANDQKGVANVGNALSFWGMRDWATHYAQDSYYPYWAGSHLFLAEMFDNQFVKNSELNQGYLLDPSIFGASNRFQTLVQKPGNYQSYFFGLQQDKYYRNLIPIVTFNGLVNDVIPISYFFEMEDNIWTSRNMRDTDYFSKTLDFTGAVGLMPTNEFRLFLFTNRKYDEGKSKYPQSDERGVFETRSAFHSPAREAIIGASYWIGPTSVLLTRFGQNDSPQQWRNLSSGDFSGDYHYRQRPIEREFQLAFLGRYKEIEFTVGADNAWGFMKYRQFDHSEDASQNQSIIDFFGGVKEKSKRLYGSVKYHFRPESYLQLDGDYAHYEMRDGWLQTVVDQTGSSSELLESEYSINRFMPSVGLVLQREPATFRLAYQDQVKLSLGSTLGPTTTAGIPDEGTLLSVGGEQHRVVAQVDMEFSDSLFGSVSIDHRRASNPVIWDPKDHNKNQDLQRLRQKSLGSVVEYHAPSMDTAYYYNAGENIEVSQFRINLNKIVTSQLSTALSYSYSDSSIRSELWAADDEYWPHHLLTVGGTWVSPNRIKVLASVNWRSKSWCDENSGGCVRSYADGQIAAYWETKDKRLSIGGFIANLFDPDPSTPEFYGVGVTFKN